LTLPALQHLAGKKKMFFTKKEDLSQDNYLRLPMLPLRDIVVFPNMVVPLFVGRDRSVKALELAMKLDKIIFLAAQKDPQQTNPGKEDIYSIGTIGQIIQMLKLPDNSIKVFVEGRARASILRYVETERFFRVDVEPWKDEKNERELELQALLRSLKTVFEDYVNCSKKIPQEFTALVRSLNDPSALADSIASQLILKLEDRQNLLETLSLKARIEKLLEFMQSEIEISHIEDKIRDRVKKQMEKSQREYYLNEQMRAIQKEMGEKDDFNNEIIELQKQIEQKGLPAEVEAKALKEIKKLKMMSPMSAEATVSRNYVDWFLVLPWSSSPTKETNLDEAQGILDEDHYGLKEVKERILEYLAVEKLVNRVKGPIICLVGPPGVGKTSLAKSVARATGREFVRISLGGVRDEAEIRGHRRTYIGALPGKILQNMKKVKSINPVMLLDEVDKMSNDFRGDPASALLEVLDPEQNHSFNDHYLDVDYDLSHVLFITTANTLHGIPAPLQDRMEIIRLPGYTEVEKLRIGDHFLVPKQLEANGLSPDIISFTRRALMRLIRRYTREAGVRNLERQISKVCRKVARLVVSNKVDGKLDIDFSNLVRFLGVPKFRYGIKEEEGERVGVATGLAWTEAGGELLIVEVALMPGSGKLTVTGKLGEVMQESAQAAMSYVRSRSGGLDLKPDFINTIDTHIHVPEGATPKDGPSAGITITAALVSALTHRRFPRDLAMTGEITLRGRVLPIGGLKEKLLAAKRGQISRVIIPRENEKELREVPSGVRKGMAIISVDHMDEVLKIAFSDIEQHVISSENLPIMECDQIRQ
jgi:ATP-dependent Lon protease